MKSFQTQYNWYKGNLHTHTSLSDGRMSPEECLETYRKAGYDFIAITDHRKFYRGFANPDMLVLSGAEFHLNDFETKRAYHITGIGIENEIVTDDSFQPQELIDRIRQQGGLAIIAHPAWSLLTHDDLMALKGYHGIEIWNTVSETHSGRGDSTIYGDVLASKGYPTLLLAVDDTHFYERDLFGGYIMVNSPGLDQESILEAIRAGRFYCSQGPEIKQIELDAGRVRVWTSPVREIRIMSDSFYCPDRIHRTEKGFIDQAEYKLKRTDRFVRVECLDDMGRKAWSQFIDVL